MPEARFPARRRRALLLAATALLGLGAFLARDRLAAALLEHGVAGALRDRLGVDATWAALDAHVPADFSRVTLRLHDVQLRGRPADTPAPLAQADLELVEADFGVLAVLGGEPSPRALRLQGGRVVLDLRHASGRASFPDVLPALAASDLSAHVLLADDRALLADGLAVGIDPPPPAPSPQSASVQVHALRLQQGDAVRELGALQASLGWRAGVLTVRDRAELAPPDGGSVALLTGARLDLADAGGPRLHGELQVRDVHLDAFAPGGPVSGANLALTATLDAPLAAADAHAWLAAAQAQLDARLARPGTADSLQLRGRLADGVLAVERGAVATSGGHADLLASRVTLGANWTDTQLELVARAELDDLAPLGALLAPLLSALPRGDATGSWAGALHGGVRVSGAAREPAFDVDLSGRDVRVAGWLAGDVTLRATGDRHLAQVAALELRAPGGTLAASGTLDMQTLELTDARAEAALVVAPASDSPDLLSRLVHLALPSAAGELDLAAQASGPLAAPVVTLQACAPDLAVGGLAVRDAWLAATRDADGLHVSEARADVEDAELSASGELRGWPGVSAAWSARLDTLRLARGGAALDLQAPCSFGWDSRPRLAPVDVAGAGGTAHVELLDGPAEGPPLHALDVRVRDVRPPEFLLPAGVRAERLDLDLHLAWREDAVARPASNLREWLADARDGALHAELRATGVAIDAAGASADALVLRADVDGDPSAPRGASLVGADGLRAALPTGVAGVLAVLRGGGEVETEAAPGEVVLVGGSGRVPGGTHAEPSASGGFGPCTLGARIEIGDELRLVGLDARDATTWRLSADGVVRAPLDLRAALGGSPALPAGAQTSGSATLQAGDLDALRDWLGDVRRLNGVLLVESRVGGTLAAPTLAGRVRIADGALRLGGGLPSLEGLAAEVEFDGQQARIDHFTGESGSAPFALSGRVGLQGDEALDLHFTGADLLIWRGQGLKARADVDVALTGPAAAPSATGHITLRDTRLTRNINALQLSRARAEGPVRLVPAGFGEPPLATLRFDLALDAAEPVRIENNIVRGACVPALHVAGTGAEPVVTGTIAVRPTRVVLPGSVVRVSGGTLTFGADEPGRPTVDLEGNAHVRHWDVKLAATGPFDEPQLALTSRPPLPDEDILLLLLTGQPPSGTRDPTQSAPGPVAVYLGQDLLARWLTESSDASGGSDRLEFGYAEDVTTRGSTSVSVSYRLSGEAGAGRALYLQAEKDPYDAVNFGLRWRVRLP